ncbi:MAG: hypothetical protein IJ232_05205 [Lachnospiraceae bacterium]|nr:hypothetical protein [Lachnospiraceae bacterium]
MGFNERRIEDAETDVLSSSRSTAVSLAAIRDGRAKLNEHRKALLDRVPNQGNDAKFVSGFIDVKDLAYLTAATGDEFALLRGKDIDVLWHGTSLECDVLPKYEQELISHKLELYAHSHPGEPMPEASINDRKFLRHIGQKKSRVISGMTGILVEFEDTL